MKNRTRPFISRAWLIGCAAALVLALSAIPALTLWLDDARLLSQPHERTRQTGALALTSDDLYLTRILKKYSQREQTNGYRSAATYPDGMDAISGDVMRAYLDELCGAGVLPAAWHKYCDAFLDPNVLGSNDSLGFTHYICFNQNDLFDDFGCYVVGITVESESQKVVSLWASAPAGHDLPDAEEIPTLEAYRAYLGLDLIEEWEDPAGTWYEGSALYSPRAELMLFCENGDYETESYRYYQYFGGEWVDRRYARRYFCLNALSLPESTVRGWQEYARSFPEGTDVWHKNSVSWDGPVTELVQEEALG